MATNLHHRSGQAMIEFVMVIIAIMLLVAAVAELLPLFVESLKQQSTAHREAGKNALKSDNGTIDGFTETYKASLSLPLLLDNAEINISTNIKFPAVHLFSRDWIGPIPNSFPGRYLENDSRGKKSRFKSWIVAGRPINIKSRARTLLSGDWALCHDLTYENDNTHEYVYVFTQGDIVSPSLVAAVYIGPAYTDKNPDDPTTTTVTVIARTAGGNASNGEL